MNNTESPKCINKFLKKISEKLFIFNEILYLALYIIDIIKKITLCK